MDKQKKIKELIQEMSYRTVSPDEIETARQYEKSLLPKDMVVPKFDDIYEVIDDVPCTVIVQFSAPYTGGSEKVLPRGTLVKILEIYDEKPLAIDCRPINQELLERNLVDEEDLSSPLYAGYYISVNSQEFLTHFKKH